MGITKDHVVPRSVGGRTIPENIVSSCGRCNVRKGDKFPSCRCKFCVGAVKVYYQQRKELRIVA